MPALFPRKQVIAIPTPFWRTCLSFACLAAALLVVTPARAGDDETFDLEAVLALEPDDPGLTISPENILQVCSTALEKKDSYPTGVVAKLFLLRAQAYAALGKFENARDDAREALKLSPDSEPAALIHALSLHQVGAIDDALEEVAALAKKNPRSARVHGTLGVMFLAGGKLDYCITACSRAIELDAQYAPAYVNRAQARLQKKDYSGCVEDMKRYLELRPLCGRNDQEAPYLLLGQAYLRLGQNEQALAEFEMARRLNPASFDAAYGVWSSYYKSGRLRMSYALAPRLVRLNESEPRAHLAVAASANAIHRHRTALQAANQAIALEPKLADAHEQSAAAYFGLGQYDSAIRQCERAIAIDPGHTAALTCEAYLLATCPEAKYRDGPKARDLATKACKATSNKDARPLLALAAAQAECGDFQEAVRLQKQALSLLDGGAAAAKEEYEKALELFEKGRPYRGEFEPKPADGE